jgi:hypothetical protein
VSSGPAIEAIRTARVSGNQTRADELERDLLRELVERMCNLQEDRQRFEPWGTEGVRKVLRQLDGIQGRHT